MRRLVATLSGLSLVLSGTSAVARTLPNYDALLDAKTAGRASAGFSSVNTAKGMSVSHRDALTQSPTFVWATKTPENAKLRSQLKSMAPEQAALSQIKDHAPLYGLSSFEDAGAKVVSVSKNRQGVKVVKVEQDIGGIEVFRQSLSLLLNRDNELVAVSGNLSRHASASTQKSERARFKLSASAAITAAYQDLTGAALDPSLIRPTDNSKKVAPGAYARYELATYARPLSERLIIPARVKQVFYSLPDSLVPAYYVELNTGRADSRESDYYSYVISAIDGSLLMRNNLTAHAEFSYRVYADTTPPYIPWDGPAGTITTPHPTGNVDGYRAPYVPPNLVTLESAPFSRNDPWLPDGATVTTGNNVDAYADLVEPDHYNDGDLRPTVTTPGVFDRTLLFDIEPNANAEQISAATTSLFYMNNWLHDWFYDAGFDEDSGNAQTSNFGRGGEEGDAILAEAQDYSGTNNANMQTPSDGESPRMQMYIFSGPRNSRLTVTSPAAIAGDYRAGVTTAASLGPAIFDVTGDVIAAEDVVEPPPAGSTVAGTTLDACSPFTNAAAVAGKIALVNRGYCSFNVKIENAQAAGAIGVIISDNAPGFLQDVGGSSTATITIPTLRTTLADGNTLRNNLEGLNVRLWRGSTINLDGTVDNAIVAHEWGHYISNRLVGDANGLINNQGRAMGEGWGDFTALLMMVRAEDINVPSNANWSGVYAMAEYATRGSSPDAAFLGIRRGGYSVDETKNALRFRHIMDGVPLPTTTPFAPSLNNAQVHNSGEIWASMLWECYVALLRAHPFQEAQDRMKSYVVNGYKMTPVAPTYTEARDAVLSSAYANDPADGQRLWAAFARRGMGVGAVAPVRTSTNHAGVVESYQLGTDINLVSVEYHDDPASPGDADGILDNGETGRLVITISNKGSEPVTQASVTVFSASRGVTVGNRGSVNFPTVPIWGTAEVSVPVSLNGATLAQRLDFSVAVRDDGQVVPGDKSGALSFKANYDEVPAATPTETVEASEANRPWTYEHDTQYANDDWETVRFAADLNQAFFGPNIGSPSDLRLVSPPLVVSADQRFTMSFAHAHDFEWDALANYDGAVIELTEDGGETWVDVGESLYNGVLVTDEGVINPLQGRRAFTGTTAGFPALNTVVLDLGNTYAGKTVQLRFRIGSDNFSARTGWVVDDIAFTGIVGTPFTKICADDGSCANTAPVISAGPDVTVVERSQVALTGTAYDRDGNALQYSWARVSGPAVTFTSGANTLNPTFTATEVTADSNLVLRLSVTDGTVTSTDTVTVRILNSNRAPTVNAGLDGAVGERTIATLSGSATDLDGDTLSYVWTQTSGTPVGLINATTATAIFTAPETAAGETLSFRLTVSDGKVSVNDAVDVVINAVNRTPAVLASAVTVDERSSGSLTATATDPDGDTLSFSWTQTSGDAITLSGADTAAATFTAPEVTADGEYGFRLSVFDGTDTVTQDVTVTVRQVNRAPVASAGADATVAARAAATLNGSASADADGSTLTYKWTQVGGPWVTLTGADTASATFTAPNVKANTDLTFRLVVNDGSLDSDGDTVTITVSAANQAPVARARIILSGDQTSMTLDGSTSSDPDGDALTYKWEQTGGPAVSMGNANQAVLSVDVPELDDDSASFSFRLTVTDANGATHSATAEATATPDGGGGCSSTGAGAPVGMIGLALLGLLRRRRQQN